jgi:signal transduction histidine kinase
MTSLAQFLQKKMIWPLVIFLGIVISTCIIICITLFYKQEIENRNLVLERAVESLRNPISLGSYVEIKSRLLSHNKKYPQYCLDFFSPSFQTNLCSSEDNIKIFDLNKKTSVDINADQSVSLYFSWKPFVVKSIVMIFLIILILLSIGLILLKKANKIADQLNNEVLMIYKNTEKNDFKILEFKKISDQFLYYIKGQSKMLENEARAEMAKQVAHDIRSPLSALEVMTESLSAFPENERVLIRHAIQRINDIANELLRKGNQIDAKSENGETGTQLTLELIPALVDILVSEKRMQYREFSGLIIEADLKDSFGTFASVNARELKRVISNLVNNSVEAFKNHIGQISIRVRNSNSHVIISVVDNGEGIPAHVIEKIGQSGFTHGKENLENGGNGLGLYHAKQTIEHLGGKIEIKSTEGAGTTIEIYLKLAEAPTWFSAQIDLSRKTTVVSLDDDLSIHQIWKKRLSNTINQKQIQSGAVFEKLVRENICDLASTQFLVDYELLNQSKTGLDLIEELGIAQDSILVTSRYDDADIQKRSKSLGLKILPKSLAAFVPIQMQTQKSPIDLILLDNDELVRMTWEMRAKKSGKKIICFSTASELREKLDDLAPETLFYIDVHLSDTENGEQVSKELFDLGFNNLYLATGYSADKFSHLTWIKGVVGKSPPKILES